VGPRPGVAAMATMLSYDGICCVGVNFDPDVISDSRCFPDASERVSTKCCAWRTNRRVGAPMSVDELTAAIRRGPSGPKIGAIFDHGALLEQRAIEVTGWAGRAEEDASEFGRQRFRQKGAGGLFHGAWRLVRAHQNHGHTVVIVASAPRFDVAPLADELGIDHVVCSEMETNDGALTGRMSGSLSAGIAKVAAIREFAAHQGVDLAQSHAYAHSDTDIPVLDAVGFPHPVSATSALARYRERNSLVSFEFRARRGRRDPVPITRTAAMYAALLAAGAAGIAAGVVSRNRRRGVDLATWLFGHVGTTLGNIDVEVTGAEKLWSHRPVVFFANHQSTLIDVLVGSRILERGFTIVAKAEARQIPVIGALFDLADVVFVDRTNTSKAILAMQPAIGKLRSGTSIAMSPEGTRSLTPKVGAFKKGGFHLARDAGVPIVPIVIRNAGEIMWRNARIAQSGTVEVVVHEPLPTAGWTRTDIEPWLAAMRQLYIDTLDDWPGVEAGQRWSKAIANGTPEGGLS
jgi:putative phosphoserine phosphatase / 1-acylglycerol-3-phosphate O-acyltransferase